jgi:hypothetical protein
MLSLFQIFFLCLNFWVVLLQKPFYQCGGKSFIISLSIIKLIDLYEGIRFTGTTCCIIGYQCYIGNDYFSQCLTSCPSGWNCQKMQPGLTTPSPIGSFF